MKILIFASNRTLTLSLLRCLSGDGITARVFASGNYPVVRALRACVGFDQFDPDQLDAQDPTLAAQIDALCAKHGCPAIITSGIEAGQYLAGHLDAIRSAKVVALSEPQTIAMLNDKWLFQKFASAAGVSTPPAELVMSEDQVHVGDKHYPLIGKPTDLDGSRGVQYIADSDSLAVYLDGLRAEGRTRVVLQHFIPGDDLSVSVLADHGVIKAWEVHKLTGDDFEYVYEPDVVQATARLVAASGFHGLANWDFRREEKTGDIYALECNPRPWASIHIAMYAGVNFAKMALDMALGNELEYSAPPVQTFIYPERALVRLALGKIKLRDLSDATLRGIALDRRDPIASCVRFLEKHLPGFDRLFEQGSRPRRHAMQPHREPVQS